MRRKSKGRVPTTSEFLKSDCFRPSTARPSFSSSHVTDLHKSSCAVISSAETRPPSEACVGRAAAAIQRPSVELESIDCPMCGGGQHEAVLSAGDGLTGIGGTFRVVRCLDCQLSFTNPRPVPRSMGVFYPDDYAPYAGHEPETRPRNVARRRFEHAVLQRDFGYPAHPNDRMTSLYAAIGRATIRGVRRREFWIPYRQPGRLLDFGCGAGDFMKRMREFGWLVEGIDVSRAVANRLGVGAGIRVHIGTLPHPNVRPESFEAVTMWHSLEHVHSPRGPQGGTRGAAAGRNSRRQRSQFRIVVASALSAALVRVGVAATSDAF